MALLLLPLSVLLIASLVLMLNAGYKVSLGWLLQDLSDRVRRVSIGLWKATWHGGGVADAIDRVNHALHRTLGEAVAYTAWPLVRLFRGLAALFEAPVEVVEGLAADVYHTLGRFRNSVLPALIAAALGPVAATVYLLRGQVAGLLKRAPIHIVKQITHITTKATTTVIHEAIAIPRTGIGRLEREAGAIAGRVGQLERSARLNIAKVRRLDRILAGLTAAGLVAAAVGRLGFGWVRCSRVRKVGRGICGMDGDLLDALLASTLLIAGSISVVRLAKDCRAFTGEVDEAIRFFVRELPDVPRFAPPVAGDKLAAYIAGRY